PPRSRRLRAAPALQVEGADGADPPDASFARERPREADGGDTPVVEPDERSRSAPLRLGRRARHRARVLERARKRLLAGHVLAGLEHRDAGLGVQIVGGRDVDEADRLVVRDLAPVGRGTRNAPAPRERGEGPRVLPGDEIETGLDRDVEEPVHLAPRVRVRAAHEFLADEGDSERGWHACAGLYLSTPERVAYSAQRGSSFDGVSDGSFPQNVPEG